jgi:hypothetical protein
VPDTIVFIPAWNEERTCPQCSTSCGPGSRRRRAGRGRRLDRRDRRARARHGAEVLSFGENRGCGRDRGRLGVCRRARLRLRGPRGRRRPASGRRARAAARDRPGGRGGRRGRLALRSGSGYAEYRYAPSPSRRFGTACAARGMRPRSAGPSWTRRAACTRSTRGAADPRGAVRERSAGGRGAAPPRRGRADVVEVPVDMRERASGESKLRGARRSARRHGGPDARHVRRLAAAPAAVTRADRRLRLFRRPRDGTAPDLRAASAAGGAGGRAERRRLLTGGRGTRMRRRRRS